MNHSKHEVDAQSKTLIRNAMQLLRTPAGSLAWDQLPCDVMHQALPANCEPNVEPGLVGDPYVPQVCEAQPQEFLRHLLHARILAVGTNARVTDN